MIKVCITSCGVRDRYLPYLSRLEESLRYHEPNLTRLFFRDVWPPLSPTHQENHYAFKAHAMKAVYMAGFDIGIWLDAACEVLAPLDRIVDRIAETGYYIAAADEPLGLWISDRALARYHVPREDAMQMRLCAGCIVGIDFRSNKLGWPFLREWLELAEDGLFFSSHSVHAPDKMTSLRVSDGPSAEVISTDPRVLGHRSDEACFSLMLDRRGLEPMDLSEHFSHAARPNARALIKTGYDL